MSSFCINCGTELPEGAGFCPRCGTKIEVPHCPSCGRTVDFGAEFCIYCGQPLKGSDALPPMDSRTVKPSSNEKQQESVIKSQTEKITSNPSSEVISGKYQSVSHKQPAPVWRKIRLMTGLVALLIIAVYWVFNNISWASRQGPSEMWTNAMHVQSENQTRDYLIQSGFPDEIQVSINQDSVNYIVDSAAWDDLNRLTEIFSESPLSYLAEGKKAYCYQYTAPFVVKMNGEIVGNGTVHPIVIWNPQKGLTPQEIQSTGYREFSDFNLSPELTALAETYSSIKPEKLIGCWELQYLKVGETVLYDTPQQYIYFQFFEDNTSELTSGVMGDTVYSTWSIIEQAIIITESADAQSVGTIQDGLLCFEDTTTAMRFEKVSDNPSRVQTGIISNTRAFDDIIGTWQDSEGYGAYLFIGYDDVSKQNAYAYFIAEEDFEVELISGDSGEIFSGTVMGYGSEPIYAIEILPYKYWLEVSVYIPDSEDNIEYIQFVPADPDTCPYSNPYYTG